MTGQRTPIERVIAGSAGIALYGAANLVRPAVALVTLPLYAWLFTPEDFGVIGVYTAILGLLVIVLPMNGQIYVLWNRVKLGPEGSARAVRATVQIASLLGLGAIALGVAWWLVFDPAFAPMWIIVVASFTAWMTAWILLDVHVHQADDQPVPFLLIYLGWAIGLPIATVALALLVARDWTALIGGMAIATGVTAAWSAFSMVRRSVFGRAASAADRWKVLRFGVPLLPHTVGLWAASFLDRFVVAAIAGIEAAGIYTVAFSVALGINAAHDGVSRYFAPRLARWSADGSEVSLRRASRFAFGYSAAAIVTIPILWIVVVWLIGLILPDSYAPAADYMPWLIVAQAFIGIARVFTGYLYAAGKTGVQSVVTVTVAAIGLLLAVWAVSTYGAIGAAYAAVGSAIVRMILTTWAASRTGLLRSPFERIDART